MKRTEKHLPIPRGLNVGITPDFLSKIRTRKRKPCLKTSWRIYKAMGGAIDPGLLNPEFGELVQFILDSYIKSSEQING